MGTLAGVWQDMKAGYVDFPSVIEKTLTLTENLLLQMNDRCNLDRHLVECFGLDIDEISSDKIFQIWLPNAVCESIVYTGDSKLNVVLKKLAIIKKLSILENKAYYTSGKPIHNINITLEDLGKKVIYYLPSPPQTIANPTIPVYPLKRKFDPPEKYQVSRNRSQPTMIPKTTPKSKSKKEKKSYHLLIKTKISPKQLTALSAKSLKSMIQQEFERASSEVEQSFTFSPSPLSSSRSISLLDGKTPASPRIIPLKERNGRVAFNESKIIEVEQKLEDTFPKLPKFPSDNDSMSEIAYSSDGCNSESEN